MKYDAFRFLWPPRPETKIPHGLIGFYEKRGWWGQIKKNGTCTVIYARGDEVIFKTRHADDPEHKSWVPKPESGAPFRGRDAWNVYVAELLHSKVQGIRDHLYLFDVLVDDGEDLSGTTFVQRQNLLEERFPGIADKGLGAIVVGQNLSRARCYRSGFADLWAKLGVEDEGIVFKNPAGRLSACVTETANASWAVKCRRPSNKYSF